MFVGEKITYLQDYLFLLEDKPTQRILLQIIGGLRVTEILCFQIFVKHSYGTALHTNILFSEEK